MSVWRGDGSSNVLRRETDRRPQILQLRATTTGRQKVECAKLGNVWSAV
jgi:hypothetical protein